MLDESGAGNDNPGNGGSDNGSGDPSNSGGGNASGMQSIMSALSEDNRQYVTTKGWKDLNAILGSYRNLEKSRGSPPSNQQSQQTGGSFGDAIKSPADYKFQKPSGLPDNAPYDAQFTETLKAWAYEAELSPKAAQVLHDKYAAHFATSVSKQQQTAEEKLNTAISSTYETLTKAFGSEESPAFKRSMELARRAINQLDPDLRSALKSAGILADHKGTEVATNAAFVKAMASVGGKIYAEDSLYGAPNATDNPFDPKKPNMMAQGKLLKENPELARAFIQAAGVDKDWAWYFKKK